MLRTRRSLLILIAAALAIANILYFTWYLRYRPDESRITYVGLDSYVVVLSKPPSSSVFQDGQWKPALTKTQIIAEDWWGKPMPVSLVSLFPHPTYAHFIEVIRDLKHRQKCNVLIVENGQLFALPDEDAPVPQNEIYLPALVLCGKPIGDAGFAGILPAGSPVDEYHRWLEEQTRTN
jgi:hypothetical protein